MNAQTFRNRQDAAGRLAEKLEALELHRPLVLGIPRGGTYPTRGVKSRNNGCFQG